MVVSKSPAVVIGEALIDLIGDEDSGSFTPLPGGSPMNVAVGAARLGSRVEFVGSFGNDGFSRQLRSFLTENGVGLDGSVVGEAQTSLAVTTFDGPNPNYAFYGTPPSYGLLSSDKIDRALLERASVIHAGSIALLEPSVYGAVAEVFESATGSITTLDPNVRESVTPSISLYRESLELLFAHTDVVKMSIEDASALYDEPMERIVARIVSLGPSVVAVTKGSQGVYASIDGAICEIPGRNIDAIDTTGAGDAFMAAILAELTRLGNPRTTEEWTEILTFATSVSAATCCERGGATAMPLRTELGSRLSAATGSDSTD